MPAVPCAAQRVYFAALKFFSTKSPGKGGAGPRENGTDEHHDFKRVHERKPYGGLDGGRILRRRGLRDSRRAQPARLNRERLADRR